MRIKSNLFSEVQKNCLNLRKCSSDVNQGTLIHYLTIVHQVSQPHGTFSERNLQPYPEYSDTESVFAESYFGIRKALLKSPDWDLPDKPEFSEIFLLNFSEQRRINSCSPMPDHSTVFRAIFLKKENNAHIILINAHKDNVFCFFSSILYKRLLSQK